jgi:hypothetical protein
MKQKHLIASDHAACEGPELRIFVQKSCHVKLYFFVTSHCHAPCRILGANELMLVCIYICTYVHDSVEGEASR